MCISIIIASYYKGDTLQGYGQVVNATIYKIDVNNAGWSLPGKACKEKERPNNWVSEMAKVVELKLIKHDEAL